MEAREALLVDLSQWLGRIQQYSPAHPACAQMGQKTMASLQKALAVESPLTFGVLKEDVMIEETPARHPSIRSRLGPYLHERGVLVLRFVPGSTLEELTAFVVLLTQPPQSVFDQGGLARIAREKGIAHVQIDEIAHEITNEEREAQRRRKKLREFFKEMLRNMLARRDGDASMVGEHMAEMLEHPDIAVTILEEDAAGVAEAAAGLALMARQEEERTGTLLAPKMHEVLLKLAPQSRDRMLLGLPSLMGEFRAALVWAVEGLDADALARLLFPSIRAHAADLDAVLYATSVAVLHEGRRMSALRRAGLTLFDLQIDDPSAGEVVAQLAKPVPEYDSYRRERECLREPAERALAMRAPVPPGEDAQVAPFDARQSIEDVIGLAVKTRGFDRFAKKLGPTATAYSVAGSIDGALGLLLSLAAASESGDVARAAARDVAIASAAAVLGDLDAKSAAASPKELEDIAHVVRLVVPHAPEAALNRLDVSESRKMRRVLLDALPAVGSGLLPLLAMRLRSSSWFVVRNAVALVGRCGGAPTDLAAQARHPNERVRIEVLRALRTMPPDAVTMDVAASCILDPADDVRVAARGLLRGELLGPSAIAQLERIASDDHNTEEIRRALVDILARSPSNDAANALFKILQPHGLIEIGASAAVRDAAAIGLRRSPAPGARALFEQGLKSTSRRVRKACERANG